MTRNPRIEAQLHAQRVIVRIRDHGTDIPETDRRDLFTRCYRGSNAAGIVGTGIGLYLAKTVIELQRGAIIVESVEGKGSCFTISLPRLETAGPASR